MALLNDGEISLGGNVTGRSINLELSRAFDARVSLNDANVRSLAGILSGTISLENFYGKSVYIYGQEEFTSPGTYTWVCPQGVTAVSVVCIGGGGGGDAGSDLVGVGGGGGGGGLAFRNNITVIPGQSYTVVVGAGGFGQITVNKVTTQESTDGESSSAFSCIATGGAKGARTAATVIIGSTADGDGGGRSGVFSGGASGGAGGSVDTSALGFRAPGGGGAAGYTGPGGAGARGQRASGTPASSAGFSGTAGTGGGAGGGGSGFRSDTVRDALGGNGGGVGIYGAGANGAGGTGGSSTVAATDGGDGSGGSFGYYGSGGSGGVGGDNRTAQDGKNGAVRIIWPGQIRAFPQTATENA